MLKKPKQRYDNKDPSVTSIIDIIEKDWMFWWYYSKELRECLRSPTVTKEQLDALYPTFVEFIEYLRGCDEKKTDSQKIGHKVHKGIEKFLRGKPFSEASEGLDNQQILMLSKLTEWCRQVKLKPISIEERMHSEKYKFNGTPDIIGTFNGGKTLAIVDWKTDSTPRDNTALRARLVKYRYQAAGYSLLYAENYDVEIGKAAFVRVTKDKDPILKVESFTNIKAARAKFLTLRRIYRELKGK